MKLMKLLTTSICALVASMAALADPVAIQVNQIRCEGNRPVEATLSFPALASDAILYRLEGATDGGATAADWDTATLVKILRAGATSATVSVEGADATTMMRFAIATPNDMPDEFLECVYTDQAELDTGVLAESLKTCVVVDFDMTTLVKQSRLLASRTTAFAGKGLSFEIYVDGTKRPAFVCQKSVKASNAYGAAFTAAGGRSTLVFDTRPDTMICKWYSLNSTAKFPTEANLFSEKSISICPTTPSLTASVGNLYSCSITNGDECVRNYLPAVKDGVAGFFETVGEKFYESASAVAFVKDEGSEKELVQAGVTTMPAPLALSKAFRPWAAAESVEDFRIVSDGTSVTFSGTAVLPGDVVLLYGTAPDALTSSKTLAGGLASGAAFSDSISGLTPGEVYYFSLFIRNGGEDFKPVSGGAFVAPSVGATHREARIISENKDVGGNLVSVTLAFSASGETNMLYRLSGKTDGEDDPAAWDAREFIATIHPGRTELTVPMPADWAQGTFALRYALTDGAEASVFDYGLEYVRFTGTQYVDTGLYPNKSMRASITAWSDYQAVPQAETPSDYDQMLFGVRRRSYAFLVFCSDTERLDVYRVSPWIGSCTATLGEKKTEIPIGTKITADFGESVGLILTPEGEEPVEVFTPAQLKAKSSNNTSSETLLLGALRDYVSNKVTIDARKFHGRVYGFKIWSGDTLVGEYVPCVKGGVVGFWDAATQTFRPSDGADAFVAGPEADVGYRGEMVIAGQTATIKLGAQPMISAEGATDNGDGTVEIAWDLVSCGNGSVADILFIWGGAADSLVNTNTLATAQAVGEGTADFAEFAPGRTYYYQLRAKVGDEYSQPTLPQSITMGKPASADPLFKQGVSVVRANYEAGAVVSHTLAFEGGFHAGWALYRAYGATCGGEGTNDWTMVEKVDAFDGTPDTLDVAVPAGWGTTVRYVKYCLVLDGEALGVVPVEYLSSAGQNTATANMYIDTGVPLAYGQTLFVKIAQASTSKPSAQDKGWGAAQIAAGLRRNSTKVQAYFEAGERAFTPAMTTSDINTQDVYLEKLTIADFTQLEMTNLTTGDEYATTPSATSDGAAFATTDNLFLFQSSHPTATYRYPGKKRIYGAALRNDATGAWIFNLVPATKDGVPGFHDLVSGDFLQNAASGTFAIGEAVDVIADSEVLFAADASLPSVGTFAVSGEEQGDAINLAGAIGSTGGGTATIQAEVSRTGDFDDTEVWPVATDLAGGGAWVLRLHETDTTSARSIVPGETAYVRIRVRSNESGKVDVSTPVAFTTLAASAVDTVKVTCGIGRAAELSARLVAKGANDTYLWVDWTQDGSSGSSEKVLCTVEGATYRVPFTFGEYGSAAVTVHCSNDCATVVWDLALPQSAITVADDTTYTWAGGATGNWSDAANWQNGDPLCDYPHSAGCTVIFPANASAEIGVSGAFSLAEMRLEAGAAVKLAGEDGTSITLPKLDIAAEGVDLALDNLEVKKVATAIVPGAGTHLTVSGGRLAMENFAGVTVSADAALVTIENGGYLGISGTLDVASTGKVVIDNATVDLWNSGKGVYFGVTGSGGEIVFKGANPQLLVADRMRTNSKGAFGAKVTFVVPVGGFASPVIQHRNINGQNAPSTYPFWSENKTQAQFAIYEGLFSVDPSSPGLQDPKGFESVLVDWSNGGYGIDNTDKIIFGQFAHKRLDSLSYDDDTAPMKLIFTHNGAGGTMIFLK